MVQAASVKAQRTAATVEMAVIGGAVHDGAEQIGIAVGQVQVQTLIFTSSVMEATEQGELGAGVSAFEHQGVTLRWASDSNDHSALWRGKETTHAATVGGDAHEQRLMAFGVNPPHHYWLERERIGQAVQLCHR